MSMVPGLAVWIYSGTIWNQYLHTLPHAPDQTTEGVYPRNIHGIVVFQTHTELLRLELTQDVAIGVFFLGLLIGAFRRAELEASYCAGAPENATRPTMRWSSIRNKSLCEVCRLLSRVQSDEDEFHDRLEPLMIADLDGSRASLNYQIRERACQISSVTFTAGATQTKRAGAM